MDMISGIFNNFYVIWIDLFVSFVRRIGSDVWSGRLRCRGNGRWVIVDVEGIFRGIVGCSYGSDFIFIWNMLF